MLVFPPFLFFLTTPFLRFLQFLETNGPHSPVPCSWDNSLFLAMMVTADTGAREHLRYLLWLHLFLLTFLRGKWSGLVEVSQLSLRQGQSIMVTSQTRKSVIWSFGEWQQNTQVTYKWPCSFLPTLMYQPLLSDISLSYEPFLFYVRGQQLASKSACKEARAIKQWNHIIHVLSAQPTQILLCELGFSPSTFHSSNWTLFSTASGRKKPQPKCKGNEKNLVLDFWLS